jgi:hypothetical protein
MAGARIRIHCLVPIAGTLGKTESGATSITITSGTDQKTT